jgi:hypothetical protein
VLAEGGELCAHHVVGERAEVREGGLHSCGRHRIQDPGELDGGPAG